MSIPSRIIQCADCGQRRLHRSRGLCVPCHARHVYHGTLDQFERLTYTNDELVAEWEHLRADGHTRAQAAERLGITKARLEKAIQRATRKGVAA